MSRNKNARSDGGASEQAKESITDHGNDSIENNITVAEKRKGRIESLLLEGKEHGIKNQDLASMTNLSPRGLRIEIQQERANGSLILFFKDYGYFLPSRTEDGKLSEQGYLDVKRFYHSMKSMGIGCLTSAKAARIAIKEYEASDQEATDGRQ